jgi:hypothetical protein
MAEAILRISGKEDRVSTRSKRRILLEVAAAYALIMLVIWTPRPWQKILWWIAAAAVAAIAAASFNGIQALGLGKKNLLKSLWIAAAALLMAAIAIIVAIGLHTLHLPSGGAFAFVKVYWAYALWACFQQLLLQAFFLPHFLRLFPSRINAALVAAGLFALAHLPNPTLTPLTLLWGFVACLLFLHYRNVYPLALAHVVFGITIAITVPGPLSHNMRVGLGYLTYHRPIRNSNRLPQP